MKLTKANIEEFNICKGFKFYNSKNNNRRQGNYDRIYNIITLGNQYQIY